MEETKGLSTRHKAKEWPLKNEDMKNYPSIIVENKNNVMLNQSLNFFIKNNTEITVDLLLKLNF